MTRGLIERGETLLGHIPGINDERDSVPLLLAFRQLWPEIKAALERRDAVPAGRRPQGIASAPRDGTEIYLVSIQPQDNGAWRIVSIHNGYWSNKKTRFGETEGFMIGQPGFESGVGDNCATHWLPRDEIDCDGLVGRPPSNRLPKL